jgi:Ca2+-binding RTX toxin-like protein
VRTRVRRLHHRQDKPISIAIKEEYVLTAFESIIGRRGGGDGRRGAIVLAAALAVFFAALVFSSSAAYGAPKAKPSPEKPATKEPAKTKPKVKASIRRGQLNVLGTAKSDRITLRLKPGNKSRLQVDAGSNGSAEFTFKRSAFNRIVVHGASGADALSINERFGVFTNTEATSLFGDSGNDVLRSGSAAERLFGGSGNDTIDGKRGNDLIEGGAGSDLVVFNGSKAAETFAFSAIGKRLRFVGAGTMSIAGVERFDLRASDGADNVVVNDLTGAGLGRLNADLANDGTADVVDIKGSSSANELRVGGAINITGVGTTVNVSRAQAANDRLNLDPGAGSDRVTVEGTAGNDAIGVAAAAAHISISGGPAGIPIDVVNSEALAVESLAGNDTLNAGLGLASLTQLTLDGGAGNDAINGGDGNDTLRGGSENDAIDGNRGADTGLLGAGDDSFTWDPGDGSDKVEGEAGSDTMVFNGAAAAENFDFSANGNRLRLFRAQGAITMDTAGVERVDLNTLGGIDKTVVNDLSATDVTNIDLDLASDGAVDTTTVNGTAGTDAIAVAPNAGAVDVTGLAAAVRIEHPEAANDLLNVNGLAGNDTISGAVGLAALIKLGIDGGAGNDTINGGDGAETLLGGDGDDAIDGNGGNDTGLLGAGNDTFIWDPGDGSDVVEGQDGADDCADTMLFNGAAGAENFDLSASGNRVRFFRAQGAITMDLNDIEFIDVQALGGADTAVVNDTTGTDLKTVAFDLEAAVGGGAGDGAADSVTVNGTNNPDDIQVTENEGGVLVTGTRPAVQIDHSEAANDKLTVNGLGGADTITAGPGLAALIQLVINGGTEADLLTGGDGNDRIAGEQQNDAMFGGGGNDTLVWNPGDANDLVEGQAGNDTMEFNGSAGAEAFDASAVAGRLRFTRDLGNIVMDVGTTERVDLTALGGTDTAVVNDLTGTGVTKADIDLAGVLGGAAGDGAADTITVNGTNGPDNIAVAANGGVVDVTGLSTAVGISNSEVANDLLAINGRDGNDDVAIGGGVAALIQTLVDLGPGE